MLETGFFDPVSSCAEETLSKNTGYTLEKYLLVYEIMARWRLLRACRLCEKLALEVFAQNEGRAKARRPPRRTSDVFHRLWRPIPGHGNRRQNPIVCPTSVTPHLGLDIFRDLCLDRPWHAWRGHQRARIVLLASQGQSDSEISRELNINRKSAALWRQRVAEVGAQEPATPPVAREPEPVKPETVPPPANEASQREIGFRTGRRAAAGSTGPERP